MDTLGVESCRPFIEAAKAEHPSLIDINHVMAERFGVINIPNGIWIDEEGIIVRPAEPAPVPGGKDVRSICHWIYRFVERTGRSIKYLTIVVRIPGLIYQGNS